MESSGANHKQDNKILAVDDEGGRDRDRGRE